MVSASTCTKNQPLARRKGGQGLQWFIDLDNDDALVHESVGACRRVRVVPEEITHADRVRTSVGGIAVDRDGSVPGLAWARPQRGADHPRQTTVIQRLTFAVPGGKMTVVIALHDVHDVAHWLSSPKRDEIYRSLDITEVMASEAGSEATRYDDVHPDLASCSWDRSQGLRLPVPPRPYGSFAS
jgi:hypothetical protein